MNGVNNIPAEHFASDLDMLREIASQAYGSREGWSGGKGNIGLLNGRVVKFNTHWKERRQSVDAKNTSAMCNACNDLRDTLLDIARRMDGQDQQSDFMKDIAKSLGCNLKHMDVKPQKLLDRKIVAKVVDKLLQRGATDRKSQILDEAKDCAVSSEGVDTTCKAVVSLSNAMSKARAALAPEPAVGQEQAQDAGGVHADGPVADQNQTVFERDLGCLLLADALKREILKTDGKFATTLTDLGLLGEELKRSLLRMLSSRSAITITQDGKMTLTGIAALKHNLKELMTQMPMLQSSAWERKKWNVNTFKKFEECLLTSVAANLECIQQTIAIDRPPEGVDIKSAKAVPQESHPEPGQDGGNVIKKGTFFKQGHNTCFLLSCINALLCTDAGVKVVKERLFNGDGQLHLGVFGVMSTQVVGSTQSSGKFSLLERELHKAYVDLTKEWSKEVGVPVPVGALGQMGTAGWLFEKLGYQQQVPIFMFDDKDMSLMCRRQAFAQIASKFVQGHACILRRCYGPMLHFMAITGVYANPDDPEDFGFYVSDSLNGNIRKVRAVCGGDSDYSFDAELQIITFRPTTVHEMIEKRTEISLVTDGIIGLRHRNSLDEMLPDLAKLWKFVGESQSKFRDHPEARRDLVNHALQISSNTIAHLQSKKFDNLKRPDDGTWKLTAESSLKFKKKLQLTGELTDEQVDQMVYIFEKLPEGMRDLVTNTEEWANGLGDDVVGFVKAIARHCGIIDEAQEQPDGLIIVPRVRIGDDES